MTCNFDDKLEALVISVICLIIYVIVKYTYQLNNIKEEEEEES